jgi:hypothetical protein
MSPRASERQGEERPVALGRDLSETRAQAAREITTRLWTRQVGAAEQLTRLVCDAKRCAMAIHHVHVRAVALEANELVRAISEAGMIVSRHRHVGLEA